LNRAGHAELTSSRHRRCEQGAGRCMNTRPARPARQCPPRRLGGRSAVRSPPSSRTRGGPPILMPRGRPSTPSVRRHRGSRLYPRGQGSPGRRWL